MRITFQTKANKALLIDFGYATEMCHSMYWLNVNTEFYIHSGEVNFAKSHISWFKHWKYWFK